MRKYIIQIILISFIFLYENSSAYWLHQLGKLSDIIWLGYSVTYLIAVIITIHNMVKCINVKFKVKRLNIITLIMMSVLIMSFLIPGGLMPKSILYKGNLLVAYLDGVAGNNGYLTLYGNNIYEYNYGGSLQKGRYKVVKDTVYFDSPKGKDTYNFDSATLTDDNLYLSFGKDSIAYYYMKVIKNDLIK